MDVIPLLIKNIWEEKELYPVDNSIFACNNCGSFNLENDSYKMLASKLNIYRTQHAGIVNYQLSSRYAPNPKYIFGFVDFHCSTCSQSHKAFFYTRFEEKYFPENEREFFLAEIDNQKIDENIDGVYNRNTCQIFMQKLLIRWYILTNITYLVVPFIGNPFQKPIERLNLLGDFLSSLNPYKTLLITKPETKTQIKTDFDFENGQGAYDTLYNQGAINPIIMSLKTKPNFHAKFYCGIDNDSVEVLSGSHNLHGGNSMENLVFKKYTLDKFIDRYLMQINVMPIVQNNNSQTEALVFDRNDQDHIDHFSNNAKNLIVKYF